MSGWRTWLSRKLLRHAARIMPDRREEWVRAMLAEAEHLPPQEQFEFARGCVWSSYRQRVADPAALLGMGRWAVGLGLCAGMLVCLRTAYVLRVEPVSSMILVLALVCLGAALASVRWGFGRVPVIAAAGLLAAVIAILTFGDAGALIGGESPSSRFYRAILLEQVIGWAALFGFAHLLLTYDARQRADG